MCFLPLKSEFNPTGTYEADELYGVIMNLVEYILTNVDPTKEWALRRKVAASMEVLISALKKNIQKLSVSRAKHTHDSTTTIHTFGANFTSEILGVGKSIEETVDILLGNSVGILGTTGTIVCIFPAQSLFLR